MTSLSPVHALTKDTMKLAGCREKPWSRYDVASFLMLKFKGTTQPSFGRVNSFVYLRDDKRRVRTLHSDRTVVRSIRHRRTRAGSKIVDRPVLMGRCKGGRIRAA